jgi:hypothetical protein
LILDLFRVGTLGLRALVRQVRRSIDCKHDAVAHRHLFQSNDPNILRKLNDNKIDNDVDEHAARTGSYTTNNYHFLNHPTRGRRTRQGRERSETMGRAPSILDEVS